MDVAANKDFLLRSALAMLTGSYAEDGIAGKVRFGPAWWYNDHAAVTYGNARDMVLKSPEPSGRAPIAAPGASRRIPGPSR